MAYNTVTVTNTPTLIVAPNTHRQSLILTNISTTVAYIGPDNLVTTVNAIQMNRNDVLSEDSGGTRVYQGAVWGVVATGTADIRYWERTI